MKITYVFTTVDAAAGTERAVITQANSLSALGHTVSILSIYRTAETPAYEIDERIQVQYLVDIKDHDLLDGVGEAGRKLSGPSRLIPLRWDDQFCMQSDEAVTIAMLKEAADIVVTTTPALTALAVQLLPPETLIVHEEHRASMQRSEDSIEPLDLYGPQVDALVSLTKTSTDWLKDRFGSSAPRLETIPNSVPARFYPQSDLETPLLMAAGRFSGGKNFEGLIRSFALVSRKFPDWKLRIYGSGPQEASMRRTARKLDVEDFVQIVPAVPNLLEEWSKSSVFVSASRSEGMPLVMLEAAAAGLPLVAYDCQTGPSEIIDEGKNGFLVPVGNEAALANAMATLMESEQLRSRMGSEASRTVARFSPSQIEDQWSKLFASLMEERDKIPLRVARMNARQKELVLAEPQAPDLFQAEVDINSDEVRSVEPARVNASELTPAKQSARAIALTAEQLRQSGVPYAWIPSDDQLRHRIAVPDSGREAVLGTFDELRDRAVEITPQNRLGQDAGAPWLPAWSQRPGLEFQNADVLSVRRYESDETGTIAGQYARCDVEFWATAEDGRLEPPRTNSIVDRVDKSDFDALRHTEVQGTTLPTLPLGLSPAWQEPDFPIDAVFTWVDDSDPEWRYNKASFSSDVEEDLHPESDSSARYRNRDELKYSLRSLHAYAPWIDHIYVVTAGQRPDWFDSTDNRVTFVDHQEIFADPSVLPTFNSHAIESQLHHIDGLSEHFLYFNDDVMLRSFQKKSQFFFANGIMKFFPSPTKINDLSGIVPPHLSAAMRNRDLLHRDFGVTITQSLLHAPCSLRRSLLYELEQRYETEWRQTAGARFRGDHDFSTVSSLAPYYGFSSGRAVPASLRVAYLGLGAEDLQQKMTGVIRGRFDVFSLGDPHDGVADPDLVDQAVGNFLEEVLPIPGPWEKPSDT